MSIKQGGWQLVTGCLLLGIGLPAGVAAQSVDELETRIQGSEKGQRLGETVSLSGDVTGDGTADLLVGSASVKPGEKETPVWAIFVYKGGGGWINNKENTQEPDWVIYGEKSAKFKSREKDGKEEKNRFFVGQYGFSVSLLDDFDGGSCNQVGVGVSGGVDGKGKAILFDFCENSEEIDKKIDIDDAYAYIEGKKIGDRFGFSLTGNENDLLVGAINPSESGSAQGHEGKVYRFSRPLSGKDLKIADLNPLVYQGSETDSLFGYSVALAPDLNPNGSPDLVIGAPRHGRGGTAFLFEGDNRSENSTIKTEEAFISFVPGQDESGLGVRVAGMHKNSSTLGPGVIIGASVYDGPSGKERVSQGSVFLFPLNLDQLNEGQQLTPNNAITFLPDQAGSEMGTLALLPDVDGKEEAEILVGAPLFTNSVFQEGAVFLFRGEKLEIGQAPLTPDDANAVYFGGQDIAQMGSSLSAGGDLNAQGEDDLVIGARGLDGDGDLTDVGGAFVYPGETIADLSVELVDPPTQGQANTGLEYDFRVTNPDGQAIPQAWVRIPRPADVADTGDDSSGGCIYGSQVIRCAVGPLGGNDETTVTARIVPQQEGEIEVQGTLVTEGAIDPDLGDNVTDAVTTEVAAGAVNTEPVTGGTSDGSSSSGCSSGGGGCTLQRSGFFDPTFPILVAFGAFWLLRRRAGWG